MQGARERSRPTSAVTGLLRVLYWVAVLVVSLLFVYLLIGWLEALDDSSLDAATRMPGAWEVS